MFNGIWVVWFGTMGPLRAAHYRSIVENSGMPVSLITEANRSLFPHAHPALFLTGLSDIHKSDYMRAYLAHYYGGGYADVKPWRASWKSAFEKIREPDVWLVGTAELAEEHVACSLFQGVRTPCATVKANYRKLLSNCAWVARPNTLLTTRFFLEATKRLHAHAPAIQAFPAPFPRCCKNHEDGYPLRWAELCGEIFHPLQYKYRKHLRTGVPRWEKGAYID